MSRTDSPVAEAQSIQADSSLLISFSPRVYLEHVRQVNVSVRVPEWTHSVYWLDAVGAWRRLNQGLVVALDFSVSVR